MPQTTWYRKASRGGYRCFTKQNDAGTIARANVVPDRVRPPEAETNNADGEHRTGGSSYPLHSAIRSDPALVGRSPWTARDAPVPLPEAEAGASARARAPAPPNFAADLSESRGYPLERIDVVRTDSCDADAGLLRC